MGDVIVVLPGIGGSTLDKDGRDVWAFSAGAIARALFSMGRSIKDLTISDDPWTEPDLGDGVRATRLVQDLHIVPGLWKIDGYGRLRRHLLDAFTVTEGENYFEFAYDWRRDVRAAAKQLERSTHQWLADWRKRPGNDRAKLILVGHSMGGVVARVFCELMDGWKNTRTVITFGTPYSGSLDALEFLCNGMRKTALGLTLVDLTSLLRSFTSVHQLLPSYRCIDTGAHELSLLDECTIPQLDQAKLVAALDMHRAIRTAVDGHRGDDYEGTGGYEIRPIVGEFQPTRQSGRLVDGAVETLQTRAGVDQGGDGTVPRQSAVPPEFLDHNDNVVFISERHASLQNFDAVLRHVTAVLRQSPSGKPAPKWFAGPDQPVSLAIEDLYSIDEPVLVRARVNGADAPLVATVTLSSESGSPIVRDRVALTADGDNWQQVTFSCLSMGDYRVKVESEFGVVPVTDVFSVVDPVALG